MRLSIGKPNGDDFVFSNADGTPLNPQTVTHAFAKTIKRARMSSIRLHDLRHIHATMLSTEGQAAVASVQLGDTSLAIGVWQVRVGRTDIYLLDTNLEENPAAYRQLSARLYVADREQRLQQEIVWVLAGYGC